MQHSSGTVRSIELIGHFWLSCCVYTAAKLNIADHLEQGGMHIGELSKKCGAAQEPLFRLMRALASGGYFEEARPKYFVLTPAADALRTNALPSMKAFVLSMMGEHFSSWGQLHYAVQTGKPAFDHCYGQSIWEYYSNHPAEGQNFMNAMTGLSNFAIPSIVQGYDYSNFNLIVDIGGGNGAMLTAILQAFPQAKGIIFDAPYVIEHTAKLLAQSPVANRCQALPGNFMESVPEGGDAYIMKYILHDWNDEEALQILQHCNRAMNKGGTLLAIDAVIPPGNDPFPGKLMDINMLVALTGRERTAEEFRQLFEAAGFQFNKIIHLPIPDVSIVEGKKI